MLDLFLWCVNHDWCWFHACLSVGHTEYMKSWIVNIATLTMLEVLQSGVPPPLTVGWIYTIKWYVLFLITSYFTWDNPHIASSSQSSLECVQRGFCLLLELRSFSWEATTELSLGIISLGLGFVWFCIGDRMLSILGFRCFLMGSCLKRFSSHRKSWYRTPSSWAVSRNIRWSSVPC